MTVVGHTPPGDGGDGLSRGAVGLVASAYCAVAVTRGRRSAIGHCHVVGSASVCSPERMSLTWSPSCPAPGNQTKGIPRRSAKRICLPNFAADGATGVVVISLSAALSATMQSAQLAARTIANDDALDLDVRVVDSRTLTLGLGTIVLACAKAARSGATTDEVEALARDLVERTRVFGALDTLENLKKGGRIGNAKALLATALSIKPIIEVTGGVVEQAGKQRTRSKALAHLVDTVRSYHGDIENLAVLHADCSDVDLFVEMLAAHYPYDIVIGEIGPVIGTHGGRGTIGVAFQVTGT